MIKNIAFIGMMGSGKSSVASALAKKLNRTLIECDEIIEQREGLSILSIFSKYGEKYFRDIESELCIELSQKEGTIISCGGGVILRPENCLYLQKSSWIIFLDREIEKILTTLNREHRPLAKDKENFLETYKQRLPLYKQYAHFTFKNDSIEDTIEQILSVISDIK